MAENNPYVVDLSDASTDVGGGGPPVNEAFNLIIGTPVEIKQNANGTPRVVVPVQVSDGPHKGKGFRARFNWPTGDPNKDGFKKMMMLRLLQGIGAPQDVIKAADIRTMPTMLPGKTLVGFVKDDGEYINDKGQTRQGRDLVPCLPNEAAAALKGEWNPYGGFTEAGATPTTTPSNGTTTPTPQVPSQSGFDGLFDGIPG